MKRRAAILTVAKLLAFCALAWAASARAQLAVSFAPGSQNAAAGETVVFSGTLVNSGTARAFLNNIQPALTGSAATYLAFQPNTFFANVPGILLPGQTYYGPIFSITRAAPSPPSDYPGSVAILGGTDQFGSNTLVSGSFTVLWPDETLSATSVSACGATLNASVDPNGADTSLSFQYGPSTAFGQTTPATDIGSGNTNVPFSATLGSLQPNTIYYYEVVAATLSGTTYGAVQTFTTGLAVPALPGAAAFLLVLSLLILGTALMGSQRMTISRQPPGGR